MKKWRETQLVLTQLDRLRQSGSRAALATVVCIRGSAYRREGAKLLVAEDGTAVGNVSGGCLEQDVKESALQVIASGMPRLRSYCSGADDIGAWDMGLGCDGQVEIFVEPADGDWHSVRSLLDLGEPFAVCTAVAVEPDARNRSRLIVRSSGKQEGTLGSVELDTAAMDAASAAFKRDAHSKVYEIAGHRVFIDLFEPPPRLLLIGAGDDARPLSRLAADAGFSVTVIDRRRALLAPERFIDAVRLVESEAQTLVERARPDRRCYAVLMTHNYASDREYLAALLKTSVTYIGLLGPRQRTARMLDSLEVRNTADLDRIHAPVGLDLGGEGAEQVALAIVGEVLSVCAGRRPVPLRERVRAIHARAG